MGKPLDPTATGVVFTRGGRETGQGISPDLVTTGEAFTGEGVVRRVCPPLRGRPNTIAVRHPIFRLPAV